VSGSLKVYLNGQLLTQGTTEDWIELSPSGGTFQFIDAPISGNVITAVYKDNDTSSDSLVTIKLVPIPSTPISSGAFGEFSFDNNFMYMAKGVNEWVRIPIDTSNWSS
jgi:hypothetical protein